MVFSPGPLFRAATRRWYGPFAHPERIVNVAVRNQDFQLIRVLESEGDLLAFRKLWAAVIEVDRNCYTRQPGRPYYKLAIQTIGRGGRINNASWYYFPGGYLKLLAVMRAIWVAPLYRAATPDAFAALLIADAPGTKQNKN